MIIRSKLITCVVSHMIESFKLRCDKYFIEKLTDIVDFLLDRPDKGLELCVDEKSQNQVLDRTRQLLPLRTGIFR